MISSVDNRFYEILMNFIGKDVTFKDFIKKNSNFSTAKGENVIFRNT